MKTWREFSLNRSNRFIKLFLNCLRDDIISLNYNAPVVLLYDTLQNIQDNSEVNKEAALSYTQQLIKIL